MATFRVTTLVDEDDGLAGTGLSLREAAKLAMASPGTDRILFAPEIGGVGEVPADWRGTGVIDLPDRDFAAIVRIAPGESFATAMEGKPAGTLYIVGRGVHHGQQVVPRSGDAFIGEPGATMNGALPLESWHYTEDGKVAFTLPEVVRLEDVVHNGESEHAYPAFGSDPGEAARTNQNPASIVGYPEQLFFVPTCYTDAPAASTMAHRVAERNDVYVLDWQLDYICREAVVSRKLFDCAADFELGVARFAFGYNADDFAEYNPSRDILGLPHPETPDDVAPYFGNVDINSPLHPYADKPRDVIIQNLVIEHYANPAQTGAIGYFRPGLNWLVENNEVRWNNGAGIKVRGDAAIIRDNLIHHNGQVGISIGDGNRVGGSYAGLVGNLEEAGFYGGYAGAGILIENNEIAFNRLPEVDFSRNWDAGGIKIEQTFDVQVRGNDVHHNDGRGIWLDFAYPGSSIQSNVVQYNSLSGIFIEITAGPTEIMDNIVRWNGIGTNEPLMGSQIGIVSSYLTHVFGNRVEFANTFGTGITIQDDDTRDVEGTPINALGNLVRDNLTFIDGPRVNPSKVYAWTGGQFVLGDAAWPEPYDGDKNLFLGNQYLVDDRPVNGGSSGYWRWGAGPSDQYPYPPFLSFADWQKEGQDVPSRGPGEDWQGTAGIDLRVDGYGSNLLQGFAGPDALYGADGDDVLRGGAGADYLVGGDGFDTADYSDSPFPITLVLAPTDKFGIGQIAGTIDVSYAVARETDRNAVMNFAKGDRLREVEKIVGSDVRSGAVFDDLIFGPDGGTQAELRDGHDIFDNDEVASGRDRIFGGAGDDRIWTGAGEDELLGEDGDDALSGEDGSDVTSGGSGTDVLHGGRGNDILNGGADNDHLRGDAGRDVFVFSNDFATDVVHDFEPLADQIRIVGFGKSDVSMRTQGNDTVLDVATGEPGGGGGTIVLEGFVAPFDFLDRIVFETQSGPLGYLPPVLEGEAIGAGSRRDASGIGARAFVLDGDADARIVFVDEVAARVSVLGAYLIEPDGRIGAVGIVLPEIEHRDADPRYGSDVRPGGGPLAPGETVLLSDIFPEALLSPGREFGLFLAAGAVDEYPRLDFGHLPGALRFENRDGSPATIRSVEPHLVLDLPDGREQRIAVPLFHTTNATDDPMASTLNTGRVQQVIAGPAESGGLEVRFEDVVFSGADRDFNDLIIRLEIL